MSPRCCGGASCSCVIEAGQHIQIAGSGAAGDPFIIIGDVDLEVTDNSVFNLSLTGLGTLADPWGVSVAFAPTAKLNDLPDVSVPAPTNGQVLAWNNSTSQWEATAPTTAATGAVSHDTSMLGDGSAGSPLQVQEDPAGFLTTRAPGLGVSDAGINQMVRRFPNSAARDAATPAPTPNTITVLDTAPGQLEYYTGSVWEFAGGAVRLTDLTGQEFYQLSGPYVGGRLTVIVRTLTVTTDAAGAFTILDSTELAGFAGVMSITTQIIHGVTPIPVVVTVEGAGGEVTGHTYRVDDGTPYALGTLGVIVHLFVY